jgi:hypothetical protein
MILNKDTRKEKKMNVFLAIWKKKLKRSILVYDSVKGAMRNK